MQSHWMHAVAKECTAEGLVQAKCDVVIGMHEIGPSSLVRW